MDRAMSLDPQYLFNLLATYGLQVLGGIVVLVIGFLAASFAARAVRRAADRSKRIAPTLKPLLSKLTRVTILLVTLITVLNQFGVETTSLIAVLGAAGLAIGLALQGTLSNVASGVMLLVLRPFDVGDTVEIGGDRLIVDEVGLFTTQAHTPDNVHTIVPNGRIWGTPIKNFSKNPIRRIDLVFGISYTDDMARAMAVIQEVLAGDERVLAEPAPLVAVGALADSSVSIFARPWTQTSDFFPTQLALTQRVKERFDVEGITIPFPQREVHIQPADSSAEP